MWTRLRIGWATWIVALLLTLTTSLGRAQEAPSIGVDAVRAGMHGYGESVFEGTAVDRFDVEVLGVLRDISPGSSYILARLTGHHLEQTGVIAGMSGSPVWIDGKLAGAVAFAWPFSHEAIAGITPIAAMRSIPSAAPWGRAPGAPAASWNELLSRRLPEDLLARAAERLVSADGLDARPAVEWSMRGLSERGVARLTRAIPALAPGISGKSSQAPTNLSAGAAVAAVFIDGDFQLAATGTVTERDGDRILAFGHPIAGLGDIDLPMASADIVTVLGSTMSSFKLSNTGPVVGTFVRDHASGTLGELGRMPRTVALDVTVESPIERRYAMRLARIPDLIPVLTGIGAFSALDAATSAGGVQGLDLDLSVEMAGGRRLELSQSFDGAGAAGHAIQFLFAVVDFLVHNDLAEPDLQRLELRLRPFDTQRAAQVVAAHPDDPRVHPGDKTAVTVDLRDYRGAVERQKLEVEIPKDLPAGQYVLMVGDGASLDAIRFALEPVVPTSLDGALKVLSSLGSTRQLGYLGVAPGGGVVAETGALPRLPPSIRSIWAAGAPSSRVLRAAIVQQDRIAERRPVTGLARVDFEVERPQTLDADDPALGPPGSSRPNAGKRGGAK